MSQLIVQADDIGITHAATLGILDSIRHGIVRATGLFTNRPDAAFAAGELRDIEGIDVGIDLNFVTGYPLLPPEAVPDLVDEAGRFRSSRAIKRSHEAIRREGPYWEFTVEPFDEAQTLAEARAQVTRFVDLMGRLPVYVHHHSLVTPATDRVLRQIASEFGLLAMDDVYRRAAVPLLSNDWYADPFGLREQAEAEPLAAFERLLPALRANELSILITHPGYVDAELLDVSFYSVVRARDTELVTSHAVRAALEDAGVELVTYSTARLGGRTVRELLA